MWDWCVARVTNALIYWSACRHAVAVFQQWCVILKGLQWTGTGMPTFCDAPADVPAWSGSLALLMEGQSQVLLVSVRRGLTGEGSLSMAGWP